GLVEKLNIGNEDLDIVAIGNRAAQHCERFYSDQLVTTYLDATKLIADHNFIATLAKQIQQEYHNHQFAQCYLIFNCFASALSQVPVVKQLIPFYDYDSINHLRIKCTNVIFNPNILDVLEYLIPRFIEAELFYAGSQSLVSEHAARMNAMENATKNSDDMLKQLSLAYNRQRQTIITNELVEIISGAEAI
ncbi:MAG: FoF1 ATP synthase subunit gamma, partial [Pseudomonadota bacterium]